MKTMDLNFRAADTKPIDLSLLVKRFKRELGFSLALAFLASFIALEQESWWLVGLAWLGAAVLSLPSLLYLISNGKLRLHQ